MPNVSVLMDGRKPTLILVGSPFAGGVMALDPRDGSVRWRTEMADRISRPARMLSDRALLATYTGGLVALANEDGEEMWRQPAEDDQDLSAASPMIIESSIYTLTAKGVLTRYGLTGERLGSRKLDTDWGGRRAEFVPMWRDATGLSFLDQAGRVRSFDLTTLEPVGEKRINTAVGPGMGQLGSEVLGGVLSASLGMIWSTELSGLLRSSEVDSGKTRWTAYVGAPDELYSRDGRVLAVPILSLPPEQRALVVTRKRASMFSIGDGKVYKIQDLPSPAVAPPLFDLDRQSWWILTEDYLVALRWDGQMRASRLPLLEQPYAAALAGRMLVVATVPGRIYAMPIPEPVPPSPPASMMPAPSMTL
jgi:outer membrane protein assembly factor BamB